MTKTGPDYIQSKDHPGSSKSKMMEGAGNFCVKRKRNLDPLDISEITVANNIRSKRELLHTVKAQKKTKGKMNRPSLF